MTKQWKVNARKADENYVLYVATSDEAIKMDLKAGSGSLIGFARDGRRLPENVRDDDHRDLAIGALGYHAQSRRMELENGSFAETDSIPKGLKDNWLGGKPGSNTFTVRVYEETVTPPASS